MHVQILVASLAATALLTFATLAVMFFRRMSAIKAKEIRVREFKTYENEDKWPEKVVNASRHYKNLFEMPVLFYLIVLLVLTTQNADAATSSLAVLYVLFRVLHTCIHLGSNHVIHRMVFFAGSCIVLLCLWAWVIGKFFL